MPLEPTWQEIIAEAIESRLLELHTAIPGKVISYDATKQTAEVLPVVQAAEPREDGGTTLTRLPSIPNVPVQWPRGGGYALHLPLAAGDHVLLVFSEAAIGHWRASGEIAPPGDLRRGSLGYPIAIPGIAPDAAPLADAPANEGVINAPGVFRIGGPAADFVALAAKVDAQLDALKQAIAGAALTEGNAGGLGGVTALNTALSAWPLPTGTAATKLKGE